MPGSTRAKRAVQRRAGVEAAAAAADRHAGRAPTCAVGWGCSWPAGPPPRWPLETEPAGSGSRRSSGEPGFLERPGATTLEIDAAPAAGRPAARPARGSAGRAARRSSTPRAAAPAINGRLATSSPDRLVDRGERRPTATARSTSRPRPAPRWLRRDAEHRHARRELDAGQDARLVASRGHVSCSGTTHPDRGNDASHRGGPAGFLRVGGRRRRLEWDDLPGNQMFNSLGNLAVDPAAALLLEDPASGRSLQRSGRCRGALGRCQRSATGAGGRARDRGRTASALEREHARAYAASASTSTCRAPSAIVTAYPSGGRAPARGDTKAAPSSSPELVLARQPDRVVRLEAVERPLGRAVEGQDRRAGRAGPARSDDHVAEHEHLLVEVAVGHDERIARRGCQATPAARRARASSSDSTKPVCRAAPRARMRPMNGTNDLLDRLEALLRRGAARERRRRGARALHGLRLARRLALLRAAPARARRGRHARRRDGRCSTGSRSSGVPQVHRVGARDHALPARRRGGGRAWRSATTR